MNSSDFERGRTAVRERIKTPEFSSIVGESRRRRQRHQLGGAAAVAAIALAGGAVVATTHAFDHGGLAAAGPIAAQPWSLTTPSSILDEFPLGVGQAYAVLAVSGGASDPQRAALAHTTDGGQSWKAWEIPAKFRPRTYVQGGTMSFKNGKPYVYPDTSQPPVHLIGVTVLDENTVLSMTGLTRDGGRTWQEVPDAFGDPIDSAENGWVVVNRGDGRLVAIDPATGVQHLLRHQPDLELYTRPNGDKLVVPAKDGSLWVVGSARGRNDKAVAVSRDRGRTWSTHVFAGTGGAGDLWVATVDGEKVYVIRGTLVGRSDPVIRAESRDGGQTWSTFTPVAGLRIPMGLAVTPDGALLSADTRLAKDGNPVECPAVISRDGGRTFVANDKIGLARALVRTVTGGLAYTSSSQPHVPLSRLFSSDGSTFITVPKPPNSK
ncbi:sialidase family protein [Fodinicola acaciae]|uniref:sialidase family protein n=1 Tax=Fodinicola acaciae TaxID=2681555 RepID=UPI0013D84114|nr:sialidase family protein [Fodinicola acaciae]